MRISRNHAFRGLSVLACLLLTASCGSAGNEASTQTAQPGKTAEKKLSSEASRLTSSMVAAVSAAKSDSTVDLRFELDERPQVGKPLQISVALIPLVDLERLFARFQSVDGIDVVQGAETAQLTRPEKGVPITHTLTVLPKRDGIFALTAVVLSDSETQSVTRSFSIPLITGEGLPTPPAGGKAPVADTGRRANP